MILDTNALSAAAEGEPGAAAEVARASTVAVPVIVLGEYLFGIHHSRWRSKHERWLSEAVQVFRILEISSETASHYAQIRSELKIAGTPIPSNDVWIAALCRQHALPLLSRDRHFDRVKGLRRVGW